MEISAVNMYSTMSQYNIQNAQMPPPPPQQMSLPGMEPSTHVGLSGSSQITGLDSDARAEMKDFHDTVKAAMDSGEFDAKALAEEAPQALKDMAEAQGTDVTSMLEGLPQRMENMGRMPGMMNGPQGGMQMGGMAPMGPPPGRGMGGPSQEMDSFLDTLLGASENDEVDLTSLAEVAPEEVEAIAAELGIEVEELVSDMLARIEERGDPRDRDPQTQRTNQQGMEAYSEHMGSGNMRGFMEALFAA